uniref:Uncharacterized protein n=1 Tax=Glossina austeni TaxID=7395 RepID=A0A1A9UZK5_GLOAU
MLRWWFTIRDQRVSRVVREIVSLLHQNVTVLLIDFCLCTLMLASTQDCKTVILLSFRGRHYIKPTTDNNFSGKRGTAGSEKSSGGGGSSSSSHCSSSSSHCSSSSSSSSHCSSSSSSSSSHCSSSSSSSSSHCSSSTSSSSSSSSSNSSGGSRLINVFPDKSKKRKGNALYSLQNGQQSIKEHCLPSAAGVFK